MPIQNKIYNVKFFNQLRNGVDFSANTSDFTSNFIANAGEKIKVEFNQAIQVFSVADSVNLWKYANTTIERTLGSFTDDGLLIGQKIQFYPDWDSRDSVSPAFTAVIEFITADGKQLTIKDITGGSTPGTIQITGSAGIWLDFTEPENELTALVYSFGFVNNSDSFDSLSLLTQDNQAFQATGISGAPTNMVPKGNYKSWQSGSATVENPSAANNEVVFKVAHEFVVLPYYEAGQLSNLQNLTSPSLFDGLATLKYTFQTQYRNGLANLDSEIGLIEDKIKGSVGWFNENFNGGPSDYSITGVSYGADDDINLSGTTTVNITIEKASGNFNAGDYLAVYHSYLPLDDTEYLQNQNTFQENFLYDSIRHELGAAQNTGTGIFKTVDSVFSGSTATVTVTLEYTTAEQTRLGSDSNYLLSVQIEDSTLTAKTSDRVHLIADVNTYTQDQSNSTVGLASFSKFNILNHDEELGVDPGAATSTNWNEDGVLLDFSFDLDTNKDAILNQLTFKLVATDGTNAFDLDSRAIDFSGVLVAGGVQQISVDETRGYNLPSTGVGAQFNNVKIELGANAGGIQTYNGSFAQKITWKNWVKNNNVPSAFFDASKLNNNRNFKASNYSGLNGYDIKLQAVLDLTGTDALGKAISTQFIKESEIIEVYDYDETDNGDISAADIELFDPDTSAATDFILGQKNTLMRVTWTDATPFDVTDIDYVIHRLEPYRSLGNDIQESSNLYGVSGDSILLPISSLIKSGGAFISESQIDYEALNPSVCYKLSARISINNGVTFEWTGEGYCETSPTTSIPPPTPPTPIAPNPGFCGGTVDNDGGTGITELKLQANFDGYIVLKFEPLSQADKMELLKNGDQPGDRVATTHILANSNDGELGFDSSTGINTAAQDITTLSFNAQGERYLSGDAVGAPLSTAPTPNNAAPDWFVGGARTSVDNRIAEYESDTGLTNPFADEIFQPGQQLVWCAVELGDDIIVRVSGADGTAWSYKSKCVVT